MPHLNTQNKKAQAWTADFIIMMLLLFLIVFLFIRVWDFNAITWNNRIRYEDMWLLTSRAGDALVSSSGLPPSWENLPAGEEESIQAIGLVASKNTIDRKKLEHFMNLSYALAKNRLGLSNYDMFLTIYNLETNTSVASYGLNAPQNTTRVVSSRLVTYDGDFAMLELEVYE